MSTSDTPLTDGILARLGPGDGSARMYERNVWLHHARTIEGLLYQARHQLENSQAYSKKLDGLIEEVGGCTFSCINPYEDLKAALIGLKKKTSDLEDVLAEHGWNRIEHPATFLRRLSPAGPTDAERDKERLVLDACCGSRMFWFDKSDRRAVFVDKRRETHTLVDSSSTGGSRELIVDPDVMADFTCLPFPDNSFALVVFDPPHFTRNGDGGWMAKKYGKLEGDWQAELRQGFSECFRVLKPTGTLIFKWNENEIPVSQILDLTPERPLFGHKSGKNSQTHWVAFIKTRPTPPKEPTP